LTDARRTVEIPVGGHQQPTATISPPAANLIVLDTLGRLHAHGHGIGG
jgi:hypothetical protein